MYRRYYQTLGLHEGAQIGDVKKAFRRLAKKHHPDMNSSDNTHEKFVDICEAYEILTAKLSGKQIPSSKYRKKSWPSTQEEYMRKAQERAKERARMKYEKMQKEHEAFQKSGLYDIILILHYFFRAILILGAIAMVIVPVMLSFTHSAKLFLYLSALCIIGFLILYFIYNKRSTYFKLGAFYYKLSDVRRLFIIPKSETTSPCYYCPGHIGDSRPYELELTRVKDVRLTNSGVYQHNVTLKTIKKTVKFPRSKKAYVIHQLSSLIKIVSLLFCIALLPVNSIFWKVMYGLLFGGSISLIMHLVANTKPRCSYLLNLATLIKVVVWSISLLIQCQFISFSEIHTGEYFYLVLAFLIVMLDPVMEYIFRLFPGDIIFKSIVPQPELLDKLISKKYTFYLDITGLSSFGPFFKWLFG